MDSNIAASQETGSDLRAAMVDASLPTPLYHQLFLILRERIRSGAFPLGAVLPGEQDLTQVFNVSRITVKRALNELAAAGLVSRHRGRGTVVTYNATVPVVKGSFDNLMEALKVMGLSTEVELIDVAQVAASAEIAELLGLPSGVPVQRATRVRKLEGEPFSYIVTHLPIDIAGKFDAKALAHTPLLDLLEKAGFVAVSAEQWITACSAEPATAQALKIATGSPLLKIVRVMKDADSAPIEVVQGFYRPERFQYHMNLTRQRKAGRDEWR
ncbi:HTH-type transcriptional repressor YvoA [Candidatus Phycosocius bacilliformis]|uniref:HTH-type transcriptional repressor YvoA n=1 Tax=Candidatus Phycosocius bacilliformis TaxID=1445552 RepID=A0A2P2EDN3_9PROT|nr:GntR family transcriptional regulator [Candidatus Phycosocius bacilliformis]GBF59183.1 HTH-type transcriptional repressor YvoA [Candidatus Phycosocius bacilliformis]